MKQSAPLAVALVALSLWPTASLADGEMWTPLNPRATIALPAPVDALYLDWQTVQDWPRSLIAKWRLEALVADSLALTRCVADSTEEAAVCRADSDRDLAVERVLRSHTEEDLAACKDALESQGTWATWEVVLLSAGVGLGAAALGVIVGYAVGF